MILVYYGDDEGIWNIDESEKGGGVGENELNVRDLLWDEDIDSSEKFLVFDRVFCLIKCIVSSCLINV